jgi:tetratricopeptide (TPR) repeat protein
MRSVYIAICSVLCAITLSNCGPKKTANEEQESHRADSLMQILNSPELKALNKKILDNPNDPALYNERAKVFLQLKQMEDAISDSKRALRIDSTKAEFYLTEADIFFAANQTRNSKDVLESIVRKFPENTEGLLKLGELFYFVKQYENAFAAINKALKINENLAKGYYLKGSIYKETGDTAKAISSYETAIDQDNRNYGAFLEMGIIYGARRNTIALEYYDNAMRINPTTEVAYAKAKLMQDLGKTDEAVAMYEEILKKDALNENSLYNLGAIQLELKKDPSKALDYFTRAIGANPKYAEAYFARGVCYEELKDKKSAYQDYTTCLQLKKNYEPAVDALNALGKVN